MLASVDWLKQYVDIDVTPEELAEKLTRVGLEVESVNHLGEGLEGVVTGKVTHIERHPNSDHLWICKMDVGGPEILQILTGAQNVHQYDMVPVAVIGSHLPNGMTLKKAKMRGLDSFGMLCSAAELGIDAKLLLPEQREGIFILPPDTPVGVDIKKVLGLDDVVLDIDLTANRGDCTNIIGLAREAAAVLGKELRMPDMSVKEAAGGSAADMAAIEVDAKDLCSRFAVRVLKNIKIGPSPEWMQKHLRACGMRPISNVVDVTNYVMLELGQPMHAYDLDKIADKKIVVRRAAHDEKFVTLDGQERTLDENVLMICDGEKAVGMAGIMGGENSMITDDVKTMLFEAACFDGTNIRLSSKRVGLRTDASGKFEKGLDPNNAQAAIDRACQLIEELDAGDVVNGTVDVYPVKREPVRIPFEPDRINALLGTDISKEQMLEYYKPIELEYDEKTNEIVAPTFRQDLFRTADLAEEVARFFGYDNIPTTLPRGEATTGKLPFYLRIEAVARDIAEFCGFSQGMTYSFESPKVFDKLLLPEDARERQAIVISNPLGEDFSIMRTTSLNGMLTSLATNYNRRNKNVRLYEMGNIYLPKSLPLTELPDERMQFTLGMYGDGDFFSMKGIVEEFLDKIGMHLKETYDPNAGKSFLHPGRQANIIYDGTVIGYLGEVHPTVAATYGIGERAYVAVLDMPSIVPMATFDRKYEGIAKFPAVTRDISMVVPKNVLVGQIEEVIAVRGGQILENYELFDIYEGSQIKGGYKSVAYSLTFRAKDRTLTDTEISASMKKILNGLEALGAELRQ